MLDKDLSETERLELVNNYVHLQIDAYVKNQETDFDKIAKTGSIFSAAIIFILLANLLAILSIEKNTRREKGARSL